MRTKLLAAGLGLVLTLAVAMALTPTPAPADATAAPAIVIKDAGCGMLDGDGGFVFTNATQAVITSSGQGKISCKVQGVANSTGRAVIWNFENTGLLCGTLSDITAKWQNVVSASGNATLTCQNDG